MTLEAIIGLTIFVGTYALIATERVHKAVAALAGGVLMILLGIVSQERAFEEIDFNVIFLLAGMMILAGIVRKTGVFGWLAVRAARLAGGDPYRILVVLSLITAVASAFLDNVTTVVLVGPITLFLATRLGMNPFPFLVSEILASNIGGSATLIGDPPNILIGSAAGLDFIDFLLVMTPLAILLLVVYLVAARWLFRGMLEADPELRARFLDLDERSMITRPGLLRQSLTVMGLTRAFLYAGAKRVVVSLWNVNDEATTELMGSFYERLWRRNLTTSAALREAQVAMWKSKRWSAPYYWAAFVQQGEWK